MFTHISIPIRSLYNCVEIVLSYVKNLIASSLNGLKSIDSNLGKVPEHMKNQQALQTLRKADVTEIGLISPYKAECRRLKNACWRFSKRTNLLTLKYCYIYFSK